MASPFNKVQPFTLALGNAKHNFGSDTLKVALTVNASATFAVLTDLTQISYNFLSGSATTGQTLTTTSWTQSSGTATLVIADKTLTATGGSVGPFRYVYIYNNTATNKDIIGYYDYGSNLTLASGYSLTLDFDGTNGVINIS